MHNQVSKELFDVDLLRSIETMSRDQANTVCVELITSSNTRDKKKQQLLRDINAAPNSKEMSRIMWNVLLSGMGLATLNSKWQSTYGTA